MKTLIISGHPDLKNSVANAAILDEFNKHLPDAEIRKLDELYPDGNIDVEAEQAALKEADLIVWQFPFWWYTLPWLMKKWLDLVFVHGFAHGSTAVLGGKKLLISLTTGAPSFCYTGKADALGDIDKMMEMYRSLALVCKLDYQGAMFLHEVSYAGREDTALIAKQEEMSREYAKTVIEKINSLA